MLIDLLVIMIVSLVLTYVITKNIFSPCCIFCMMYILSISFANFAAEDWRFELTEKGFLILSCGILSFVISSLLVHYHFRHHSLNRRMRLANYCISEVYIARSIMIAVVFFILIAAGYYYYSLCRITGTSGLNAAAAFRNMSRVNEIEMGLAGRWILNILRGISTAITVILVNNYFAKSFLKNHGIILFLCVIGYVALTLLSGERTSVIRIIAVAVLSFGVFWKRNNPNKMFPVKYLLLGICLFLGVLYGFSAIRHFVGRSSQLDFLDYLSFYFGSPIYNFDYGVNNAAYLAGNSGHTFLGLTNNLTRLGFSNGNMVSVHRMNVTNSALNYFFGNTYTCMFDYYADFGIVGVIVLMSIYGVFVTYLYSLAMYSNKKTIYRTTLYSFFGTTLFFAAFTEQLYSTYIAISTVIIIIAINCTIRALKSRRLRGWTYSIGKLV